MSQLTPVTQAQIDRCTRKIDESTNTVYYEIQSENDPSKTYEVRYNREYRRLTCTCPAGQDGFHNCAHGTCKHCRWAVAAEAAHKAAFRAECQRIEATREVEREMIEQDLAEAERRMAELDARDNGTNEAASREAQAVKRDGARAYERPAFSLYR